jgi:hypothetical protein
MATAAAMAALRAMALSDCGGSSSNDGGCRDSRGKDDNNGGTALVTITLVALAIAHFLTHHIIATTNAPVVTIAITFVANLTIALFVPHRPLLPLPSPSVSITHFVAVVNALSDTVAIMCNIYSTVASTH